MLVRCDGSEEGRAGLILLVRMSDLVRKSDLVALVSDSRYMLEGLPEQ